MVNMVETIAPRSDQLTADDLLAGPRTITITRVTGNEGNADQPVNIYFEGDNGLPFRPCKSMRRVMVAVWGADASKYVGNSMTVYRDPKVKWGGMEVGGIRISHMTGIDKPQTMALTATRGAKKAYKVNPLKIEPQQQNDDGSAIADKIISTIARAPDADKLNAYLDGDKVKAARKGLPAELQEKISGAAAEKRASFVPDSDTADLDDNPFGEEAA